MSHLQNEAPAPRTKSPLGTALLISFAIAAGAIVSTLDASIFEEVKSGRWLTRPFAQAQARNTASIASLEQNIGAIGKDIDFVAARVAENARRSDDLNRDRFAEIEARLAALRERVGTQAAHVPVAPADLSGDVTGLRASLNDLAATHAGAVAAMTRRLNRIEIMVGISTDMVSSVADPVARQAARKALRKPAMAFVPAERAAEQNGARPQRGHLFDVKPVSEQGGLLRLSRLPG
jgi:hypothetical protein